MAKTSEVVVTYRGTIDNKLYPYDPCKSDIQAFQFVHCADIRFPEALPPETPAKDTPIPVACTVALFLIWETLKAEPSRKAFELVTHLLVWNLIHVLLW